MMGKTKDTTRNFRPNLPSKLPTDTARTCSHENWVENPYISAPEGKIYEKCICGKIRLVDKQ